VGHWYSEHSQDQWFAQPRCAVYEWGEGEESAEAVDVLCVTCLLLRNAMRLSKRFADISRCEERFPQPLVVNWNKFNLLSIFFAF
jgi:hypothetical protein